MSANSIIDFKTLVVFWIPAMLSKDAVHVSMRTRIKRFHGLTRINVKGDLVMGGGLSRRRATETWTAFDPSTQPPTLINEGYSLDFLRANAPDLLPEFYIDFDGALRRTTDDIAIMETTP